MSDRLLWSAPLLLGLMFVYSAVSRPKPGAKWYGRLLVGIAGVYLLYISVLRVFSSHH
jgi:hypothetical protein